MMILMSDANRKTGNNAGGGQINRIPGRPIGARQRMAPDERRKQIARVAAQMIAYYGTYGVSMQAIADAVGLTLPGLRHYVRTREELLSLVIQVYYDQDSFTFGAKPGERDELIIGQDQKGRPLYSLPGYLRGLVQENAERLVLVMLFMHLAVEAHDPAHPAHEYYRDRHARMIDFMDGIRWKLPERYRDRPAFHRLVRTIYCTMDGVQIQALTNPDDDLIALWAKAEPILFPSPQWDDCR